MKPTPAPCFCGDHFRDRRRKRIAMRFSKLATVPLAVFLGLASTEPLSARDYPIKPVRFIVPFAPGGGSDIIARVIAQRMTDTLGQQVVVDNRAGAGGIIGTETAVMAAPDGYTFLLISPTYAISPAIYKLPYDALNAISAVALVDTGPFVVLVHPGVGARNVKELIAFAKSKPGALNYGSSGKGSILHLATELLKMRAGVDMVHVPYKGTGPALVDLLGGQIQLLLGTSAAVLPSVKAGRLRALAVTELKRMAALPDVPTVQESGLPGYEVTQWHGVVAPKGLSKEVLGRWNLEINRIIQTQEMKERFASEGLNPAPGAPQDFADLLKGNVLRWKEVVEKAKIRGE